MILSKLDFQRFCNTYVNEPTLKVAGLNPHAGEEGNLGNEEKIGSKWLFEWSNKNKDVKLLDLLSPDSCWNSSAKHGLIKMLKT